MSEWAVIPMEAVALLAYVFFLFDCTLKTLIYLTDLFSLQLTFCK